MYIRTYSPQKIKQSFVESHLLKYNQISNRTNKLQTKNGRVLFTPLSNPFNYSPNQFLTTKHSQNFKIKFSISRTSNTRHDQIISKNIKERIKRHLMFLLEKKKNQSINSQHLKQKHYASPNSKFVIVKGQINANIHQINKKSLTQNNITKNCKIQSILLEAKPTGKKYNRCWSSKVEKLLKYKKQGRLSHAQVRGQQQKCYLKISPWQNNQQLIQ